MAQFEADIDRGPYLVVLFDRSLAERVLEPVVDLGRAPEPVAAAGIVHRRWEAAGSAFAGCEQPDALAGATDARGDVRHRDQARVDQAHDLDPLDLFDVSHGGEDRILEGRSVTVEVQVLDAVGTTDERIVATGLEERVEDVLGLEVGSFHDQGEVVVRHRAGVS